MSDLNTIEERINTLKQSIKDVGITQNALLSRFAEDHCVCEQDWDAEVSRLRKSMQPKRLSIKSAELDLLFMCLAKISKELKRNLVFMPPVKGAIVDEGLSKIVSKLSKALDKKLAATEDE
jgi:hypothetical protein